MRGRRRGRCKVRCQKSHPRVGGQRSKETLQKLPPRRKDVVQQAIDRDDRQNHTPGPTIGLQFQTGVVKDLMALVGEKCQSCSQEPPLCIRGGVINKSDRSGRATQGQILQNHRGRKRYNSPSRQQRSRRSGHSLPVGGPAFEFPANIFETTKNQKNSLR